MNLILLPPGTPPGRVTVTGAQARHLRTVLRVTPGQPVRVGVVDGGAGTGLTTHVDAESVVLDCAFGPAPAAPPVDLLLALPRPKVLRRLWAQLAALGVGRIVLTNAERVERAYFDTHLLDPGIYTPLLLEGLQQARDTRLPRVSIHRQFRKLVEDELADLSDAPCRLVADPGPHPGIRQRIAADPPSRVLLAIGPEGGWNDFERDLLGTHGFQPVSMGVRTLRTDTAAVALLALVHEALGAPAQ